MNVEKEGEMFSGRVAHIIMDKLDTEIEILDFTWEFRFIENKALCQLRKSCSSMKGKEIPETIPVKYSISRWKFV